MHRVVSMMLQKYPIQMNGLKVEWKDKEREGCTIEKANAKPG